MGLRNPFRFAVNRDERRRLHGRLLAGRAQRPNPARGPAGPWPLDAHPRAGQLRLALLRHARPALRRLRLRHAGSPEARVQLRRGRSTTRAHNTGRRVLPPVVQPDVWYSYPDADEGLFPELLEKRAATASGRWAAPPTSSTATTARVFNWPRYYDGQPLFYEWTRDYIKEFRLNRPNGNRLRHRHRGHVAPGPSFVDNPMDMEFGPDGALYVLEYGDGFFAENPDAQLSRIDFVRGNRTPVPQSSVDVQKADGPLTGLRR